jgi:hypothetical protein
MPINALRLAEAMPSKFYEGMEGVVAWLAGEFVLE